MIGTYCWRILRTLRRSCNSRLKTILSTKDDLIQVGSELIQTKPSAIQNQILLSIRVFIYLPSILYFDELKSKQSKSSKDRVSKSKLNHFIFINNETLWWPAVFAVFFGFIWLFFKLPSLYFLKLSLVWTSISSGISSHFELVFSTFLACLMISTIRQGFLGLMHVICQLFVSSYEYQRRSGFSSYFQSIYFIYFVTQSVCGPIFS